MLRRKENVAMKSTCRKNYLQKWECCLSNNDNDLTAATEEFEETASASEIVGYYIETYGDEAFENWISNTKDIIKTQKDKEVDSLFYQIQEERRHTLS